MGKSVNRKVCFAMQCNLRPPDFASAVLRFKHDSPNEPTYKCNNSAEDVTTIGEHLSVLLGQIFTAHAQKLLFLSLWSKLGHRHNFSDPISYLAIGRRFQAFLLHRSKICYISISVLFALTTLNMFHMLRSALG